MAARIVQTVQNAGTGSASTTLAITVPATTGGTVLFLPIGNDGGSFSSISMGGGAWSLWKKTDEAHNGGQIWVGVNVAAGTTTGTVTFGAATSSAAQAIEVAGFSATTVAASNSANGVSTAPSVGPVTPQNTVSLWIGMVATGTAIGSGPSGGFTGLAALTFISTRQLATGYLIGTAAQAATLGWTITSGNWDIALGELTSDPGYGYAPLITRRTGPRQLRRARMWRIRWSADTSSGPVANVQNFSASVGFTSSEQRAVTHNLPTAVLSFTGSVRRAVVHGLPTAVLSFTGSVQRAIVHGLPTAALSFTGSLRRAVTHQIPTAILSFTSSQQRAIGKAFAPVLSFTGSVRRAIVHTLPTAVLAFVSSQQRAIVHTFAPAVLSFTGVLTSGRQFVRSFTASLGFTSSQQRGVGKALAASVGFAGSIRKAIGHGFSAVLGFVGNLVGQLPGIPGGPGPEPGDGAGGPASGAGLPGPGAGSGIPGPSGGSGPGSGPSGSGSSSHP